jgi:gallate dioxygenase
VGISNLHIYAAMRGQSLEDFQQNSKRPGALFVTGKDEKNLAWEKGKIGRRGFYFAAEVKGHQREIPSTFGK